MESKKGSRFLGCILLARILQIWAIISCHQKPLMACTTKHLSRFKQTQKTQSNYQRFLKIDRKGVTINQKKITTEARFDGKFVLLTNTGLPTEEVATSYKNLWQVERAFSDLKSILEVRPVFHRKKRRIQGHIFLSFLALYLKIALQKALEAKDLKLPWDELMGDLRAVKAIKLDLNGSSYLLRTDLRGVAHKVFQAVGAKVPPTLQILENQKSVMPRIS